MRYLLAFFLPFVAFFTIGKPISGLIAFFLQIILIGWLPAFIWAVFSVNDYNTKKILEASHHKHRV